ncbi:hypothetical protein GCM10010275_04560 [Streptomyces litmocidini]|nr:hypothetical protein GCM10010275_04560 [Streptomyces litmocidini]
MAPTVVTAVAEATANPRTEIRLTRFPSSTPAQVTTRAKSCPWHWSPTYGVTEDTGPWCCGRHTATAVELCGAVRTPEGARVPYAGPDGSKTLPDGGTARQFRVAWESSHLLGRTGFGG